MQYSAVKEFLTNKILPFTSPLRGED